MRPPSSAMRRSVQARCSVSSCAARSSAGCAPRVARGERLTLIERLRANFAGMIHAHQRGRVLALRGVQLRVGQVLARHGARADVAGAKQRAQAAVETRRSARSRSIMCDSFTDEPNSRSSSAPGSSARMNASPTRKQPTPRCAHALHVLGPSMPLSVTTMRSAGMRVEQIERRLQTGLERLQIAVVDADERRLELERALELRRVVHFDQHRQAELARHAFELAHARQSRAPRRSAECSRRRPRALRAPDTASIMKSLRSTGRLHAARAARRSSSAPWKNCASVSTDRHAAP